GGDSQLRLERNPLRLLDSKVPQEQPFKDGAPKIIDHLCDECGEHWSSVRRLLDAASIEYQLNPYLVRGLDYYTRTVFEFYPGGAIGQQDALASGGRYDGLAEAEGWPATPGVGFAGGLDRVPELMRGAGPDAAKASPADLAGLGGVSALHCGSVRSSDEGREHELYGWVARRRDMGGVIFIDLRDRWGKVQVVFNPTLAPSAHAAASDLRSESVVRVAGVV